MSATSLPPAPDSACDARRDLTRNLAAPVPVDARAIAPDALKAAAIFAVVYIHASQLFGTNEAVMTLGKTFRFCVPAFITVWAYFQEFSYTRRPSWRANVPNRFLLAMLPFLVWTAIYSVVAGVPSDRPLQYLSREWSGYGWSGQYFFIILLQLIILFPLLRKLAIDRFRLTLIVAAYAVAFALVNLLPLPGWFVKVSYRPFVYWLPYVALGIYLARHRDVCLPLAAGAAGILLIAVEALLAWPHPSFDADYTKPGVLIGSALIAASLLNRAALSRENPRAARAVLLLGTSTMGIFVLNPLAVKLGAALTAAAGWRFPPLGATSAVVLSLCYAALLLLACLTATLAFKRAGLGRLVS